MALVLEQLLNGLQFGLLLFLLASGLTLTFGIMGLINLAHGSLFMIGAYLAILFQGFGLGFAGGIVASVAATFIVGLAIERSILRELYERDHLQQVVATFGIILTANELVRVIFGSAPQFSAVPTILSKSIEFGGVFTYPSYRLLVIGASLAVAAGMFLLIQKSRLGMLIRAGASNRRMVSALGVDVARLYMFVFGLGAALAALAGALAGPILSVQPGMGERILILTFVVIVIGGLGSIQGALVGAILVGIIDTLGRVYIWDLLGLVLPSNWADDAGGGISSMLIYILMTLILIFKPRGLLPEKTR